MRKARSLEFLKSQAEAQEGVINLGLDTSAGIGERKPEVTAHRDVTNKSVREIPRKGNFS